LKLILHIRPPFLPEGYFILLNFYPTFPTDRNPFLATEKLRFIGLQNTTLPTNVFLGFVKLLQQSNSQMPLGFTYLCLGCSLIQGYKHYLSSLLQKNCAAINGGGLAFDVTACLDFYPPASWTLATRCIRHSDALHRGNWGLRPLRMFGNFCSILFCVGRPN
jgi:hypothetical protein